MSDTAYAIDHSMDRGGVNVAEREDTNANPVGVFRDKAANTGFPQYILEDFELRESVDAITGEVKRFLNVRSALAHQVAEDAPNRVIRGREELTDEDIALATEFAKSLTDLMQTAGVIDQFLESGIKYSIMSEVTRGAVKATRWVQIANGWASRLKSGEDEPEGLTNMIEMVRNTNRRIAIIDAALYSIDPDVRNEYRYSQAAWSELRAEANRHLTKHNEAANNEVHGRENEKSATQTLISKL